MSLYDAVRHLRPEARSQLAPYYQCCPFIIRHYCSQWIEAQPWEQVNTNSSEHQQAAFGMLNNLLSEVAQKAQIIFGGDSVQNKELEQSAGYVKYHFGANPLNFVLTMAKMLATERQLVQLAQQNPASSAATFHLPENWNNWSTTQKLEFLQIATKKTGDELDNMGSQQQYFLTLIKNVETCSVNVQTSETEQTTLLNKTILQRRLVFATEVKNTLMLLEHLMRVVVDGHLLPWQKSQRHNGNGAKCEDSLDKIQEWYEILGESVFQHRFQLKEAEALRTQLPMFIDPQQDLLPSLQTNVMALLNSLLFNAFVIEHQPPQVMKMKNQFRCSVRLLLSQKIGTKRPLSAPKVTVSILNEAQTKALATNNQDAITGSSGTLANNETTMKCNSTSVGNQFFEANFSNLSLKAIQRPERKNSQTAVTEEKHCLSFHYKFKLDNKLIIEFSTQSLPIVVIVHGSQECLASATILWDNAFAKPGRTPFEVSDQVPLQSLIEQLNWNFISQLGKDLSPCQLRFLAGKFSGCNGIETVDDDLTAMVSRRRFHKENLFGHKFSFYEWFYEAVELIKDHLLDLWNNGCVVGFVSRQTAEAMLLLKPLGTFLLRFSESVIGGISITWTCEDHLSGARKVLSIQPYTSKDLGVRSCANRISDLAEHLQILYPDTPRDQAFGKFCSATEPNLPHTNRSDYVPSGFKTTLLR